MIKKQIVAMRAYYPHSKKFEYVCLDKSDYKKYIKPLGIKKWSLHNFNRNTLYARTGVRSAPYEKCHQIIMQDEISIMKEKYPNEVIVVDHKDKNGLNCRRSNLRVCTNSQNCMNKANQSNSTNRYKCIAELSENEFRIRVGSNYRSDNRVALDIYLSNSNIIFAQQVYNEMAKLIHKEYADLRNVPYSETARRLVLDKVQRKGMVL